MAIAVAPVAVPISAVPAVAAPVAVAVVAVAVAPVAVPVAVVRVLPAEGALRLMDGGADRRPDLLARRPGLGLGAVRSRGDRLAHVLRPGVMARTTVPIAIAAVPVAIAAPATPVGVTASVTVVAPSIAAVPAVAVAVAALAAALAGIGPTFTAATAVPAATAATAAFRIGNVVMDRRERNRQTAKERNQSDHDDCQNRGPEERCHGWTLLP